MPQDPLQIEDFRRCADFHGHVCIGLTIGYRAAQAALDWLHSLRASDEELVAEVETDACGADAVQVLTGCTFGKGNLVFKDRGKQAFVLFDRSCGQGVRAAMRAGAFAPDPRQREIFDRMHQDSATSQEVREFWELQKKKSQELLEMPLQDLFYIQWVSRSMPDKANVEPSEPCDGCGEPTMASKLERIGDCKYCRDCAQHSN